MLSEKELTDIKEYAAHRSIFDRPEDIHKLLAAYEEAIKDVERLIEVAEYADHSVKCETMARYEGKCICGLSELMEGK